MILWTLLAPLAQDYVVELDEKRRPAYALPIEGVGAILHVGEHALMVDGPGIYRFREAPGRLYRVAEDGKEGLVSASVEWTFEKGRKVTTDPLPSLTPEELRGLRGIRLEDWPDGTERRLAQVDWTRAHLTITDSVHQKGVLPPLPSDLRFLEIDENSSSGIKDLSGLAALRALRVFRADLSTADDVDLALLRNNVELLHLDLDGKALRNTAALSSFPRLSVLRLGWNESLKDVEFARDLRRLSTLDIRRTGVADLRPLDGLPSLETLNADMAPVTALPKSLPALKSLRVMSSRLNDEDVAAFRAAHPACHVAHRWDAALRDALAKVDRVRVREGGTCHREGGEKTLVETMDAKEISTLVDALRIEESGAGFHCMCCGEPSFEFYRGETLEATLGFHHGQSLRWPGGWPGDGKMTKEAAELVAGWLAKHKVDGPQKELERGKRQEAAAARRWGRTEAILSPAAWEALRAAKGEAEALKALEGVEPRTLLRLFGCDDGSWNLYAALDSLLKSKLKGIDAKTLAAALEGGAEERRGAARWLLNEEAWKTINKDVLRSILPSLAREGLSHPRAISRRRTTRALIEMKEAGAVEPLRAVLRGELKPRALKAEEEVEPGGMVSAVPDDLPEEASDAACAAYALLKLDDAASLDQIRALRGRSQGEDRELLDKALGK